MAHDLVRFAAFRARSAVLALGGTMAITAALAGCGAAVPSAASSARTVTLHYQIVAADDPRARTAADGRTHDTFWTDDSTIVHVGDAVKIIVSSYDDMPHSMVFMPAEGMMGAATVAREIAAGSRDHPVATVITFIAGHAGKLRWYCSLPCDTDRGQWAMGHEPGAPGMGAGRDGFMAGYITVG